MKKTITTIAFGLLCFTLSAQVPNYVPTNGLIGWWPFSGNANDYSSNVNNGSVNGATLTSDRFGNANSAYDFDGIGDSIIVNSLPLCTNYSFNGWVNCTNIVSDYPTIYNMKTLLEDNRLVINGTAYALSDRGKFHTGTDSQANIFTSSSSQKVNDGNWHMLTVVYNYSASQLQVYLDNVLINTTTISGSSNFAGKLKFGNGFTQQGPSSPYDTKGMVGNLDDIGIWNRALTQQEITNLYNGNICYQNITVTDTLLINTTITGFNPVTYQNTIKVWPNPTNDHITIDNGNIANLTGYQIKITNSLSQQVFQSAITQQQFYVDLSTWSGNGIYFVHIIDAQGNTIDIKKIVLQ